MEMFEIRVQRRKCTTLVESGIDRKAGRMGLVPKGTVSQWCILLFVGGRAAARPVDTVRMED